MFLEYSSYAVLKCPRKIFTSDIASFPKRTDVTSQNKIRTTWNIVRSDTGKKIGKEDITSLNINGMLIQNQQTIANSFNNYFSTAANHIDKLSQIQNGGTLQHILRNCRHSYPNIKFRHTSTKEIEKIIRAFCFSCQG